MAAYAVPFGIVGGRLYHIITTWQPYFGKDGDPVAALYIWRGGLGIWGAVALGALGAWIGCRRAGVSYAAFADAAAPGIIFAQAIGRWGNWFNNELYGRPTTAPWGLQIHQWDQVAGRAVIDAQGHPVVIGYFQPTFLFESRLPRRARDAPARPRPSAEPAAAGRSSPSTSRATPSGGSSSRRMRSDQANHILGLRVNVWTSVLVFLLGVYLFRRAGRAPVPDAGPVADGGPATDQTSAGDAEVPADATPDPAGVGHPTERPPNDHDAR